MLYKSTKLTGRIFMVAGSLILLLSLIIPIVLTIASIQLPSQLAKALPFNFISTIVVFLVIFFSGLQVLALGQVIYLIADIAEHSYEDNRVLKYIAKKISAEDRI